MTKEEIKSELDILRSEIETLLKKPNKENMTDKLNELSNKVSLLNLMIRVLDTKKYIEEL